MLQDIALITGGLIALFIGGEGLIRAASRLATAFGVPALVVAVTVVALGTSMPEAVVSISATAAGSGDVALGNILGSNIANIGLILGLCGLVRPLRVDSALIRREMPVMVLVTVLVLLMALDGQFSRLEGVGLIAGYVAFTLLLYRSTTRASANKMDSAVADIEGEPAPQPTRRRREALRLLVSLVILVAGAQLTVTGAISAARQLGISELLIGLTVVAVGTSLPELTTSLLATRRGHDEIAAGNAVGSNIANLLLILGLASLVAPFSVPASALRVDLPVALAFTVGILPLVLNRTLARWQAALVLAAYAAYVTTAVLGGG